MARSVAHACGRDERPASPGGLCSREGLLGSAGAQGVRRSCRDIILPQMCSVEAEQRMITLFSIPKPFHGHFVVIQRNAIRGWTLLRPSGEIILFGDDQGVAEAAAELRVRHIRGIARNEYGTPLLSDIFEKAQLLAGDGVLCYVNADIILMGDFPKALGRIRWSRFLIIGQRWDLDVVDLLD